MEKPFALRCTSNTLFVRRNIHLSPPGAWLNLYQYRTFHFISYFTQKYQVFISSSWTSCQSLPLFYFIVTFLGSGAAAISEEIPFKTVDQSGAILCFAFAVIKCELNIYISDITYNTSDVSKPYKGKEGKKVICTF